MSIIDVTRWLNTPLALRDTAAAELCLRIQQDIDPLRQSAYEGPPRAQQRSVPGIGTYDTIDGVAVIPITGVLVHGESYWGEQSYGAISAQVNAAMADRSVGAIALQIASPGGEVSGMFDLAEAIYGARDTKPVWAIVDDHAYSAAYALASGADRVVMPRTGGVGSIGVLTLHMDLTKALEGAGIKLSFIQYGERKTDYAPFRSLSDPARARLQEDVNAVGEMFVETVARNRGLSRTKVRSTEAGVFMGQAGIEAGLADAIQSPQEALDALVRRIS
jgi:signal peptide peptidase SppA